MHVINLGTAGKSVAYHVMVVYSVEVVLLQMNQIVLMSFLSTNSGNAIGNLVMVGLRDLSINLGPSWRQSSYVYKYLQCL